MEQDGGMRVVDQSCLSNKNTTMTPNKKSTSEGSFVDWFDHLEPIIEVVKDSQDNQSEPLTQKDVDSIIGVLKAKLEFSQDLITFEQYKTAINNAWD